MRRIVNLRILLVAVVGQIALIMLLLLSEFNTGIGAFLISVYFIGLSVGTILCVAKSKTLLAVALLLTLATGIITSVAFEIRLNTWHDFEPKSDTEYSIHGYVDTIATDGAYVASITLDEVSINGESADGKVRVIFGDEEMSFDTLSIGYEVTVSGNLFDVDLINDTAVNGTAYRKDVRYNLYALPNISIEPASPGVIGKIRLALFERLRSACGHDYGAIVYCMLTGDKSELDLTTARYYNLSGIGHVLAVSGLHIGLLVAIMEFVLKKCKLGKKVRIAIIFSVLLLYALFVGFTASVVRASIMSMIALLTMVNGERKDALSSLCCAATLILMFEPFLLFEVGFLLSFSAVFGLILFSRTFDKALRKIHIPAFVSVPISATLSVHLGILPVSAYFFGAVQTYSIITNILLVPLISMVFTVFVFLTPVSVLLGIDVLLRLGGLGIAVTDLCIGLVSELPFVSVQVISSPWLFLIYPAYFAISRFLMLPKFKRTVSVAIFALCVAAVAVPTAVTSKIAEEIRYSVIPVNGYGDVTTVFIDEKITVIGDLKDTSALSKTLKKYNIRNIDMILLNKLDKRVGEKLADFVYLFNVAKIVCPLECTLSEGLNAIANYKKFYLAEETDTDGVTRVFDGKHLGYIYEFSDKVSVLTIGYSARYTSVPYEILNQAPIIRAFMYLNFAPDRLYITNMPKGYLGEVPRYQFSTADEDDFVFKVFDGEILKRKQFTV